MKDQRSDFREREIGESIAIYISSSCKAGDSAPERIDSPSGEPPVCRRRDTVRRPVIHVSAAHTVGTCGGIARRQDDDVIVPIAVDVPRSAESAPEEVSRRAWIACRGPSGGCAGAGGRTKEEVRSPLLEGNVRRPYQDVIVAIAVDVARRGALVTKVQTARDRFGGRSRPYRFDRQSGTTPQKELGPPIGTRRIPVKRL